MGPRVRDVTVGFSWFQVGFHGSRWVFMVFHGSRSIFMVFMVPGRFSWLVVHFHVENTPKLYSGLTIQSRLALAKFLKTLFDYVTEFGKDI